LRPTEQEYALYTCESPQAKGARHFMIAHMVQ
jgi:acyl-CoA thioesterase